MSLSANHPLSHTRELFDKIPDWECFVLFLDFDFVQCPGLTSGHVYFFLQYINDLVMAKFSTWFIVFVNIWYTFIVEKLRLFPLLLSILILISINSSLIYITDQLLYTWYTKDKACSMSYKHLHSTIRIPCLRDNQYAKSICNPWTQYIFYRN